MALSFPSIVTCRASSGSANTSALPSSKLLRKRFCPLICRGYTWEVRLRIAPAWCPVIPCSPFAAFVPDGSQLHSKIELLDSGIVKCSSDSVISAFSIPERLFFSNSRPVNTYFEATVISLIGSISSLSIGFSEPKKSSNESLNFQHRAACLISVTLSTITCNGVVVADVPEEFQTMLKASAKQKGTVFGVHLNSTGNSSTITFSVATFSADASASPSTDLGSDAAASAGTSPSNALKPVPTKLLQYSVPWSFPDTFYPVVEIMQGSFHLNSGEVPFSLEVPIGASVFACRISQECVPVTSSDRVAHRIRWRQVIAL